MIAHDGSSVFPEAGAPTIREIGIGLGRMPRFAGQVREWYPVLAHSIVVAALLPPSLRVYGLLHDAHEAIIADVPTPWKDASRRQSENIIQRRIYERLVIAWPTEEEEASIKGADAAALAAEAHVLGHAAAEDYWPRRYVDPRASFLTRIGLIRCRRYLDAETAAAFMEREFGRAISARVADRLARGA